MIWWLKRDAWFDCHEKRLPVFGLLRTVRSTNAHLIYYTVFHMWSFDTKSYYVSTQVQRNVGLSDISDSNSTFLLKNPLYAYLFDNTIVKLRTYYTRFKTTKHQKTMSLLDVAPLSREEGNVASTASGDWREVLRGNGMTLVIRVSPSFSCRAAQPHWYMIAYQQGTLPYCHPSATSTTNYYVSGGTFYQEEARVHLFV